jgi:hypothetical protein
MPCFLLHRPLGISRERRLLCRPRQAAPCRAPGEEPGMAFALLGCVTAQEQHQELAVAVAQCHRERDAG